MNKYHPRFALLAVVAALSLLVSACGVSGDTAIAAVGSASLSQADLETILEANGVEDTSVVATEVVLPHISEWLFFESWIDLATGGGTALTATHLDLARAMQEQARVSDPTMPAADTPYGRIILRYGAVGHLVADHLIASADVTALCSSHLLVETEAEAIAALARLEAGEDFAALAAEISIDLSASVGGDLGCIAPTALVAEFVEGAAAVGGSGVSAPVQSQFGWHVISVRSFGPVVRGQHPELSDARITEFVLGGYRVELQRLQAELFSRNITVDPRFGSFDAVLGRVVPNTVKTNAPGDSGV